MDVAFALASFGFILGILLTKACIQHLLTVVVNVCVSVCLGGNYADQYTSIMCTQHLLTHDKNR